MRHSFINDLIKKYPNDYVLGKAIRFYFNLQQKNKEKSKKELEMLFYNKFK